MSSKWLLRLGAALAVGAVIGCASRADRSLERTVRGGCSPDEGYRNEAIAYQKRGEDWRRAWLRLAERPWPADDAWCGIASLSVIGDSRVVPALSAALGSSHQVPHWSGQLLDAAYDLSSFPQPTPGQPLLPLLKALEGYLAEPPLSEVAYLIVGHIDHPLARALLEREFGEQTGERQGLSTLALAIQADPKAIEFAHRLRQDSTSAGPKRLRSVALALLVADPSSVLEGVELLDRLPEQMKPPTGRRAVQVVCERALRRPAEAQRIELHRATLEAELDRLGIWWRDVPVRSAAACS